MASRKEVQMYKTYIPKLKSRLPDNYGVIAKAIDPDVNLVDLHNCAHGKSSNKDLVALLEEVALIGEKKFAKK